MPTWERGPRATCSPAPTGGAAMNRAARRARRQRGALRGVHAVSLPPVVGEEPPALHLRRALPRGRRRARRTRRRSGSCRPSAWCRAMPDAVLSTCGRGFSSSRARRHDETAAAVAASRWLEARRERSRRRCRRRPWTAAGPTVPRARQTPFAVRRPHGSTASVVGACRCPPTAIRVTVSVSQHSRRSTRRSRWRTTTLLPVALVSTHAILTVAGGEFVSLLDPPDEWRTAVAGLPQRRRLAGAGRRAGQRDTMLASPIILYDYPQVAPRAPATSSTAPRSTRSSRCAS